MTKEKKQGIIEVMRSLIYEVSVEENRIIWTDKAEQVRNFLELDKEDFKTMFAVPALAGKMAIQELSKRRRV